MKQKLLEEIRTFNLIEFILKLGLVYILVQSIKKCISHITIK